jgi:hypothetical protein
VADVSPPSGEDAWRLRRLTWILVVGVFRGDFAPRADGARDYRFYAETANITGP